MNKFRIRLLIAAFLSLTAYAGGAAAIAGELQKPEGDVVLTVRGLISNTNADGRAEFDMAALQAMPATTFKTKTTWTTGVNSFTGVTLKALLEAVGAKGTVVHAIALNDYAVDIPVSDAVPEGPILAYLMNDRPMSIRDNGPLWIVYPYDSDAKYRTEATYAKSIWQLSRIEVK